MSTLSAYDRYVYRTLIAISLLALGGGAIFYHFIEKWSYVDSFYFCVVTLTTVGYGDLVPHSSASRLFTSFYILTGIAILSAFISAFAKKRGLIMHQRAEKHETKHKQ